MPDKYTAENEQFKEVNMKGLRISCGFKRIGSRAYLAMSCPKAAEGQGSSSKGKYSRCQSMMLQSCKIRGLLPMRMLESDGRTLLFYDITSSITLKKFLEAKRADTAEFTSLILQIYSAIKQCGEYLLDSSCIILDPEFIYIDPYDFQLKFLHFPVSSDSETEEGFRKLVSWILGNTCENMANTQIGDIASKLKAFIDSGSMSMSNIISEIEKIEENGPAIGQSEQKQNPGFFKSDNSFRNITEKQREAGKSGTLSETDDTRPWYKRIRHTSSNNALKNGTERERKSFQKEVLSKYCAAGQNTEKLRRQSFAGQGIGEGCILPAESNKRGEGSMLPAESNKRGDLSEQTYEGHFCDENDRTELLCAASKEAEGEQPVNNTAKAISNTASKTTAFLRNLSGDVTIELQTGNNGCIIGRKKDMANCVINSRAIGKIHAEIVEREGEYYIKDLNSQNGTCVNSVRIEPGTEIKLSHRDVLTFANEDYILMLSGQTPL